MIEISRPETISRFRKQRFLLAMSEDRFRDEVVRPLFLRRGLQDGRDVCGPFEKGKDAVFLSVDKLGQEDVYVVQTKKGNINLARKAHSNLIESVTQLRTAFQTKVVLIQGKKSLLPTKVILCVSGQINEAAKQHIVQEIGDPRLVFLDSDELIPMIDQLFAELWLGINAEVAPYFRRVKEMIETSDDTLAMAELLPRDSQASVATDGGFVVLQLYRMTHKLQKVAGKISKVPHIEQIPVTALLKQKKQKLFAILGGAGSGKSTTLKRLAYVITTRGLKFDTSERPTIPLLLRASDILDMQGRSLVEICDIESRRLTGLSTGNFSAEDLSGGRALILIDGLDEVGTDEGRLSVLSTVKQFHTNFPLCTVVLAARDYGNIQKLPPLGEYQIYNLHPINYKQAQQIIKALQKGKSLPVEKSQEVVRRLEQVHGMELNPLLVTVFAATSEYSRQDIPANITELFKKFTEMMLGRWDASKGFRQQYHAPLKDFILTKIAFEMHREKITKIDQKRFDQIVKTELDNRGYAADLTQLRDEMLIRSGLFRVTGDEIEFRHLMIQEFFAGRGIPNAEFLHTVVPDYWWRRAVVFYFGEHPGNAAALSSTITALKALSTPDTYNPALTLGLALQACYLVELKDKIEIYHWVVDGMASAKNEFMKLEELKGRELMSFIVYYLMGRDSVALSVLETRLEEILELFSQSGQTPEESEIRMFWVIVGLIECGALEQAESLIRKFRPSDLRLLFGLFMGCYFTQHVRMSTKQQRDTAKRISDYLAGKIGPLRTQLIDELKSDLIELREAITRPVEVESNTSISSKRD
jgi:hypothetical protein